MLVGGLSRLSVGPSDRSSILCVGSPHAPYRRQRQKSPEEIYNQDLLNYVSSKNDRALASPTVRIPTDLGSSFANLGRRTCSHIREHRVQNQSLKPFRMSSSTATAKAAEGDNEAAQKSYKIVQDVGNFAEVEAKRPDFDQARPIEVTKSPYPNWKYGDGVPDNGASLAGKHHEIDPYAPDRPMINNYRLLVSGIAPRPVGFLSTVNSNGQKNLSPFSYFQVIDHDPPMFIVGFSSRPGRVKDTYRNLKETGECVINTVSENMIEAVNASSIDAPYGVSEWDVSGLHEAPSSTVKPSRVQESVFNIEGKVIDIKEFSDHQKPGMSIAATVLIKATRFWVKEGTADADYSHIDLEKLRPVGQLGGVSYGRVLSTFERPRTKWNEEVPKSKILEELDASKPK